MTYDRPEQPEINEVIAQRYLVGRQLREESWGGVWLAQDNLLRTEVALKLFPRDDLDWAPARDMFEHAAILGLKLRHPQILGVFHVDKAERFLYLVQEPFLGESLLTRLARQDRFSLPQVLHLLDLLTQALAWTHQQGEVHQFLSPVNILLQEEDLRLANFAFAPAYGDQPQHLELKAYVPPEVLQGDRLTPAGNVFSLGVLGFRLIAGSLPYALTFDEPFPYRLEYPPVDLEEIPVPLQNVLLQCLLEDPEARVPHAGHLVEQLRQARELMRRDAPKPYADWRPEESRASWQPLAQIRPLLAKARESAGPLAQKAKDASLNALGQIKVDTRRLWWGAGLVLLMVVLILAAVKISRQGPSLTKLQQQQPSPAAPPAPAAAPAPLPAVGGGPPLTAAGPARSARSRTPTASLATPGETSRQGQDERFILVVATYKNMKPARQLQRRLRDRKLHAVVVVRKSGDKTLYQVRVGPLTGSKAAQDAAGQIKSQEKINPKVVKLKARTANNHHRRHTP